MAAPELSVVCKSCGSEVSPYVTECPYCGARLRRRAPKLEREGDEIRVREGRREKRARKVQARRAVALDRRHAVVGERPYATIAAVLIPAILLIVQRAADLTTVDVGAIVGFVDTGDGWRYLAAPFVYDDVGYVFAVALAMVMLVPFLERHLGAVPTVLLLIACGSLGMLAAVGVDNTLGDGFTIAAGGNATALGALGAWFAIRSADARADPTGEFDVILVIVGAAVLLMLPLVEDYANFWAGLSGGLVGLAAGWSATLGRR